MNTNASLLVCASLLSFCAGAPSTAVAQGPGPQGNQNGPPHQRRPDIESAVKALTTSLETAPRLKALEYLAQLGPEAAPAVPALIEALDDSLPAVQIEALIALERIGPAARQALPTLISFLNGRHAELKAHHAMVERAIDAIGAMGKDAAEAVPLLARHLKGEDPYQSAAAGLALARILPRDSEVLQSAVPVLVRLLKMREPSILGDASRALALIGPAALPELIKAVDEYAAEPEMAANAEIAIAGMRDEAAPAVPALIRALAAEDPKVAMQAARTLGSIGPGAKDALPELKKLLRHPDPSVRAHVASAIGDLGPITGAPVDDLVKLSRDGDPQVRREAVEALGRLGSAARSAIPALIAALDDPAGEVSVNAALALTRIGPDAVPMLVSILQANDDEKARHLAVLILREFEEKSKPAVATLTKALASNDTAFARDAMLTLARIGPDARSAAPALMSILGDETNKLRGPAAYALANIGAKEAIPVFADLLDRKKEDPRLQMLAASGLVLLDPNNDSRTNGTLPALVAGLGDHWSVIRHESATALRLIGPRAAPAVARLTGGLNDPEATLRIDFLWALASIGPEAAPALPEIVRIMQSDEFPVRYAACYAAGSIGPSAGTALPVLLNNLQSRDDFLQFISAWAYVHIATDREDAAARCLEPLQKGLKQADARARSEAAQALGRLGSAARPTVATLRGLSRDDDPTVRTSVAQALEKIEK